MMDYPKSRELALRLMQGETIDRFKLTPHFKGVVFCLKEFRTNANAVLRQIRKSEGIK
jgi:hypothetical protein